MLEIKSNDAESAAKKFDDAPAPRKRSSRPRKSEDKSAKSEEK